MIPTFPHSVDAYGQVATASTMNHSLSPNVEYKVMGIKDHSGKEVPRIAMVSKKVINVGEELLWNYGERSKKIVADNA